MNKYKSCSGNVTFRKKMTLFNPNSLSTFSCFSSPQSQTSCQNFTLFFLSIFLMSEMCLQNDVKLLVSDVLQLMKEKWNHTVYDFKCDGLDYRILQRDKTVTWNIPTKTPQFLSSQKYEESHLIWSFIIIHADGVRVIIKVIVHPK